MQGNSLLIFFVICRWSRFVQRGRRGGKYTDINKSPAVDGLEKDAHIQKVTLVITLQELRDAQRDAHNNAQRHTYLARAVGTYISLQRGVHVTGASSGRFDP